MLGAGWGGAGCCLISGFPSSSKMLGSYFGHHPYKKGVTECKDINETYNEQTQEPFPDAHNTQRLFFFFFISLLFLEPSLMTCDIYGPSSWVGLGGVQRCAVCSFSREGTATVCWRQDHLLPATGGPWVSHPQGKCS